MSLSTSLRAYADCVRLFDAAIADPKGARAKLGTFDACLNMRTRMHYYRGLDREANANTYPAEHPQHGTSAYDDVFIQIVPDEDGEYWLYMQRRSAQILAIEGLSEVPDLIDVEGEEVHLIEDQSNACS
jgi:hypothetical protein